MILRVLCYLFLFNVISVCLYSCACSTDRLQQCQYIKGINIRLDDNGGLEPVPVQNNEVYAKALIIYINEEKDIRQCTRKAPCLGINAVFAMCKKDLTNAFYKIKSFRLFVDRDYDSTHPAGKDLQDLCILKGDGLYLMTAPDDTSGRYVFSVEKVYTDYYNKDTLISVSTAAIKLKK